MVPYVIFLWYTHLCHILSLTRYGIKLKVIVQVDYFSESVRMFLVRRANHSHRHNKHKHLILTCNNMPISGVCFLTPRISLVKQKNTFWYFCMNEVLKTLHKLVRCLKTNVNKAKSILVSLATSYTYITENIIQHHSLLSNKPPYASSKRKKPICHASLYLPKLCYLFYLSLKSICTFPFTFLNFYNQLFWTPSDAHFFWCV